MITKKRKILNLLVPVIILGLLLLIPRYISNRKLVNRFTMQPAQGIIDSHGNKQGEWKTYDAAGNLRLVEHYLDNELHGVRKVYYDNDTLRALENYHKGVQIGLSLMYHRNGNLNAKEFLDSTGTRHGPFEIYYENGELSQRGVFNKGRVE